MENDTQHGDDGKLRAEDACASPETLAILQRYSRGEIADWEAAELMGEEVTRHDVFALIRQYRIPLPLPSPAQREREIAAAQKLFGFKEKK